MEWTRGKAIVLVESSSHLGPAQQQGLTEEALRSQLSRLGNTAYDLETLEANIEATPSSPSHSSINSAAKL